MRPLRVSMALLLVATLVAHVPTALAQCEVAKLTAFDGAAGDEFSQTIAISGDTVIVGATLDDDDGSNSGSAYVYRLINGVWEFETKLTPSDAAAGDAFGRVAIDGDLVVIGASQYNSGQGAAYLFRRDDNGTPSPTDDAWIQEAKLVASDGASGDRFASENGIAVSGDTVVIGARADDDGGSSSGSAYVFRKSDGGTPADTGDDYWYEEQKLTAADGAAGDEFGVAVSIDGETIVVSAYNDDDAGSSSGSAYLYRRSDNATPSDPDDDYWYEEDKLTASDSAAGELFGSLGVSVDGGVLLVGAYASINGGTGSAYIFRRHDNDTPFDPNDDYWFEEAKLIATDGAPGDEFGLVAALNGNRAVIGARLDDDNGASSGSAYIFGYEQGQWIQLTKLTASDGQLGDRFGRSVAISGNYAAIGAYFDDDLGSESGSAYLYAIRGDCDGDDLVDACEIIDEPTLDQNANGSLDECEDSDGDGIPDQEDACPQSDLSDSIDIADCDSEVVNVLFEEGCAMSDLIQDCAEQTYNHGAFVSCVAELTNAWKQDGLIGGQDKGRIQSCAAQSDIGYACSIDAHCDDGVFCNGVELCLDGDCITGDPCPEQNCDEVLDECYD